MPVPYPFSAVLGCALTALDGSGQDGLDDMGLALVLNAISPEIGGVLVRGEKGTAKSTTVRALASVLPPVQVYAGDRFSIDPADPSASSPDVTSGEATLETRPVRLVELPVGATEDRVLGSLHLERALAHGKVEYEPGLLARAHRGLLYVDEVNLLHDHLVDLLLDAAAMGRVSVERDGVSVEYAARFVLIGTMNPEEGELRPQLLDRFGLTVEVAAPRDPALRVEVVRRRMAYDSDPAGFAERYRASDEELRARVSSARSRLASVRLGEAALLKIAEVCAAFEVDGLRADIVTARAAVAHAAWSGRSEVARADIRRAALLALPHRRRRNPFDAPGLDEELLDQILGDDELPPEPEPPTPDEGPDDGGADDRAPDETVDDTPEDPTGSSGDPGAPDETAADTPEEPTSSSGDRPDQRPDEQPVGQSPTEAKVAKPAAPYRPKTLTVQGVGAGTAGRRSRAISTAGHRIGARAATSGSLHLVETIKAAAQHGRRSLQPQDLRVAVREGREANLILFCVDASGSMAARKRMTQVKTAILSLLLDAYRRRDKVGLVTFRGQGAEVALPPTHSVDIAAARLEELPAGGRTPLAEGLVTAAEVLLRERTRDPRLRPLLVLVTDGRATGGNDAVTRSQQAAAYVAGLGVATVVIDSESGPMRLGLAARIAEILAAEHLSVGDVSAETLTTTVGAHTSNSRKVA